MNRLHSFDMRRRVSKKALPRPVKALPVFTRQRIARRLRRAEASFWEADANRG